MKKIALFGLISGLSIIAFFAFSNFLRSNAKPDNSINMPVDLEVKSDYAVFSNKKNKVIFDLKKGIINFGQLNFPIKRCDDSIFYCINSEIFQMIVPKRCDYDQIISRKGYKKNGFVINFDKGFPDGDIVADIFSPAGNGNFGYVYNAASVDTIFVDFEKKNRVRDMLDNGDGRYELDVGPITYRIIDGQNLFRCTKSK